MPDTDLPTILVIGPAADGELSHRLHERSLAERAFSDYNVRAITARDIEDLATGSGYTVLAAGSDQIGALAALSDGDLVMVAVHDPNSKSLASVVEAAHRAGLPVYSRQQLVVALRGSLPGTLSA